MIKKMFIASLSLSVGLATAVAASPAQAAEIQKIDFKDVPKTHGMYKEIMEMRDQGIIYGYHDNTFKPTQAITRVQVAALFNRSLDLKEVRKGKEFKDVPKSSPHYKNVQAVYKAGIFDGNSNGTFGASDKLTRSQMSKVLVKAFDLKLEKGYIFTDINEGHWYKDYVATLYANGITAGSNGKFMPNDSVTRAQYSAFLYRSLNPENAIKPSKPLQPTPPVTKPQPKPPVTNPQPGSTPPGATLIKNTQYEKHYSYNKAIPGGSVVTGVIETKADNSFLMDVKLKDGSIKYAVYYPKKDTISFLMSSSVPVSSEALSALYEIGREFESYRNK